MNYFTGRLRLTSQEIEITRERVTTMLASLSDAVLSLDRHGKVVFCSGRAAVMFGVRSSLIVGRPLFEAFPGPEQLGLDKLARWHMDTYQNWRGPLPERRHSNA
jgi:PAS domain-containing protein